MNYKKFKVKFFGSKERAREDLEAIETELGAGNYPDAELRNAYSLIRRLCGYAGNVSYGYDNADRTMRFHND